MKKKAVDLLTELMGASGLDLAGMSSRMGLSEYTLNQYMEKLHKNDRVYMTLQKKIKSTFGLDDGFFEEGTVFTVADIIMPSAETKEPETVPEKITEREKKVYAPSKKTRTAKTVPNMPDEKSAAVKKEAAAPAEESDRPEEKESSKDLHGDAVTEKGKTNETGTRKGEKAMEEKGTSTEDRKDIPGDLISVMRNAGTKMKVPAKKAAVTPEIMKEWADAFEKEVSEKIEKSFDVMKAAIAEAAEAERKPVYPNRKIEEMVTLASKVKEDDLDIVIMILKKLTR